MPPLCTICTHPKRKEVEKAIVAGESSRSIAKRFGSSSAAVLRHKNNHIAEHLEKAQEVKEVAQADSLLEEISNLRSRVVTVLDETERVRDWQTFLKAHKELRSYLELFAKLEGRLQSNQVNILVQPVWIEVKAVIMSALKPYPQAAAAVVEALKGVA